MATFIEVTDSANKKHTVNVDNIADVGATGPTGCMITMLDRNVIQTLEQYQTVRGLLGLPTTA